MKISFTLNQLDQVIEKVSPLMKKFHIFTFSGPLGVGKSTFIRALLEHYQIKQAIPSPTFSYVNTYKTQNGLVFHHFDLYRLTSCHDFIDAGFDEYLVSDNTWSFVEWPEIIKNLFAQPQIANNVCHIQLIYDPLDIANRVMIIDEQK